MQAILTRVRDLLRLIVTGHAGEVWQAVTQRVYSNAASVGLRRDLAVPFPAPTAKAPITIRPLLPGDQLEFLDVHQPGLSDTQVSGRLGQQRLLQSGIQTCHVATNGAGRVCYMQWLIAPSENARVRAFFGNLYPWLRSDEALLEGAYTPEEYRGQGIMTDAMAQIAERGRVLEARWVITFVDEGNAASLKGCERAGLTPYVRRREAFRVFVRGVTFTPLATVPTGRTGTRPTGRTGAV